jgi:stress-induced morphogen
VDLPLLNRNPFAKTDVEVENNETHVKQKKAHHKGQHFLITVESPPFFRIKKASTLGYQSDYLYHLLSSGIKFQHKKWCN